MNTETTPSDTDAEAYLLSTALIDSAQVLSDALALGITAESFHDPRHAEIWRAILGLVQEGVSADLATLHIRLKAFGKLEAAGGIPYLVDVSGYVPTTLQAKFFARRIRDAQIRRDLLAANSEIASDAHCIDGTPAEDVLEDAAKKIMELDDRSTRENWQASVASALERVECRLDRSRQSKADSDALSFGFADMDRVFGPMRCGQLVVLAARPSVGKSSLARQIALHHALPEDGAQVLFASLEVVGSTLALSFAQTLSGISIRDIGPNTHAGDAALLRDALNRSGTKRLDILAASSVSLASIRARCEVLRARGTPVRLIVLDYLQLLPDCAPNKGETRAFSVGRVSRQLKAFALAANAVVIVLSQLNRDSAKDGREPALHDLRESGDIEQDADKVLILHRPDKNPETGSEQVETSPPSECPRFYIRCIQAKGRDDGTGVVGLSFRRAITRFEQIHR
jgi:replicative DNA helicase